MNTAQKKLLDKTMRIIGWLCVIGGGGWALLMVIAGIATKDFGIVEDIFQFKRDGKFIWITLPTGIALLWIRAFLRAGNSEEQTS